mgnify:CR=1 FL=1
MKIQISDIISGKGRHKNIDYVFEMNPFEFEGDIIKPVSSCSVQGDISSKDNILLLNINIKVNLEMNCSRCLDTFIYPIDIDIEERFTNNSDSEDEAIKRVCKTECKGLCQTCGCNLNHDSCTCDKDDVDVRFEVLKGFFNNKEV